MDQSSLRVLMCLSRLRYRRRRPRTPETCENTFKYLFLSTLYTLRAGPKPTDYELGMPQLAVLAREARFPTSYRSSLRSLIITRRTSSTENAAQ